MAGCTRSIDISASLNQELHNLKIAMLGSNVEASESIQSWNLCEHACRIWKFLG
jgi:hypothetical protein